MSRNDLRHNLDRYLDRSAEKEPRRVHCRPNLAQRARMQDIAAGLIVVDVPDDGDES